MKVNTQQLITKYNLKHLPNIILSYIINCLKVIFVFAPSSFVLLIHLIILKIHLLCGLICRSHFIRVSLYVQYIKLILIPTAFQTEVNILQIKDINRYTDTYTCNIGIPTCVRILWVYCFKMLQTLQNRINVHFKLAKNASQSLKKKGIVKVSICYFYYIFLFKT